MTTTPPAAPREGLDGFLENLRADALSGFLVSLIALPLCLGIASASGFPPIMGVLTAVVGGVVATFFRGSSMTIKGPAAGLIVIVAGAVEELGRGNDDLGWKLALGAVVVAGALQVLFGALKVARLADFFPLSAVHGMLAAIGLVIISKQTHAILGAAPSTLKVLEHGHPHARAMEPLELLAQLPTSAAHASLPILVIGLVSLLVVFGMPKIPHPIVKRVPPALVVLVLGIVLGFALHLGDPALADRRPLVNPGVFTLGLRADFSAATGELRGVFVKYVVLFLLIGSLESVLTGKAIDLLDPWKRKANLSQDLVGVGVANVVSGLLGGMPMIAEVARSSANVANGGRSRFANFFHGLFLLLFVVLGAVILEHVPVAALAAMLVAVGFRLASPSTFFHAYETGKEQLFVFVSTIVVTLASDLLIGVGVGIVLEFVVNLTRGMSIADAFRPDATVEAGETQSVVKLRGTLTFSNWLPLQTLLTAQPASKDLVIDVSEVTMIDHTVMQNLVHFEDEFESDGKKFVRVGFEDMVATAHEPTAARVRASAA